MNFRQKLFSNMFLRNMLASFGGRSAYTKDPGSFVRYFQYKIGPYQSDQYLYFPEDPYAPAFGMPESKRIRSPYLYTSPNWSKPFI